LPTVISSVLAPGFRSGAISTVGRHPDRPGALPVDHHFRHLAYLIEPRAGAGY
jgi:hypothetical protein